MVRLMRLRQRRACDRQPAVRYSSDVSGSVGREDGGTRRADLRRWDAQPDDWRIVPVTNAAMATLDAVPVAVVKVIRAGTNGEGADHDVSQRNGYSRSQARGTASMRGGRQVRDEPLLSRPRNCEVTLHTFQLLAFPASYGIKSE